MTYNLGLAKAPGNDTRLRVARMYRASSNELRCRERDAAELEGREERHVPRKVVMAHLYWRCIEQRHIFRESRAIAAWYDRVGLYAVSRSRWLQVEAPEQ